MSAVRYFFVLILFRAFLSLTRAKPENLDRFEPDICVKEYNANEYYFAFCGAIAAHGSCSAGCGCEADESTPSIPVGYCYLLGAVQPPPIRTPCWLSNDGSGVFCGGIDSLECPRGCECITNRQAKNLCWHPDRDGIRKCNDTDLRECPLGCECVIVADLADACLTE